MLHLKILFCLHLLLLLAGIAKIDGKYNQKDCTDDQDNNQEGCHTFFLLFLSGVDQMEGGIVIVGELLRVSLYFYPSSYVEFSR
jgi:hypothetical protein